MCVALNMLKLWGNIVYKQKDFKASQVVSLTLDASIEDLCYGSTAIINLMRGTILDVRIWRLYT